MSAGDDTKPSQNLPHLVFVVVSDSQFVIAAVTVPETMTFAEFAAQFERRMALRIASSESPWTEMRYVRQDLKVDELLLETSWMSEAQESSDDDLSWNYSLGTSDGPDMISGAAEPPLATAMGSDARNISGSAFPERDLSVPAWDRALPFRGGWNQESVAMLVGRMLAVTNRRWTSK